MHKDLEMELLRYQRLASLGRELEGFVHNVAGPLNIIMGYVQILKSKYPEEKGLLNIWNAVNEVNNELQEISFFLEHAQYEPFAKINIKELITNKLELLRSNSEFKHNIESAVEFEDALPLVWGIYSDIVICLDVILCNAILAVQEEAVKKIVIRSEKVKQDNKRFIKITVRDTGSGVNEELLQQYFESGFSGWKNDNQSSGVGLALARYIMSRNGGSITLTNSGGFGAEASLYIPVRERHEV